MFSWPRTRRQASCEIRRLRAARGGGFTFGELDAEQAAREARRDAPVVPPRGDRRLRRVGDLKASDMTTPTVIETRRNGNQIRPVGPRVELTRYTVPSDEQRLLSMDNASTASFA